MSQRPTRREVLRSTASTFAAAAVMGSFGIRGTRAASPGISVSEVKVISQQPEYYCGWPTVCRRGNGELWVTWSGGREAHVCPFGQVVGMNSRDGGRSWTYPRVLLDSAMDDRDSGCLETARGTLIVTTFTSDAYVPYLKRAVEGKGGRPAFVVPERVAAWQSAHDRLSDEQRKAGLGCWAIRSTDGGLTWSARIDTVVNSPHGPIQLSDGRLLYPGKHLWTEDKTIGVAESLDDGVTWRFASEIPTRPGDVVPRGYHELHGVEVEPGRILVQIRNHNKQHAGETLQTESSDGGKTWNEPHSIGVWGLPSQLMRLRDGRLMMTYGHRRAPYGNQARLSSDGGKSWGEAMVISGDGAGGDLGYPSTVQLDSGELVTVWYEKLKDNPRAVLRQARWNLG